PRWHRADSAAHQPRDRRIPARKPAPRRGPSDWLTWLDAPQLDTAAEDLGPPHFFGFHVVVAIVVEGVTDERHRCGSNTADGEPPDVPDHRERGHAEKHRHDEAGGGVARHVDRPIYGGFRLYASLLHVPERITAAHHRDAREVVDGRRRGGRPLERAALPGIAGQIAGALTLRNAHHHLSDLQSDAAEDDDGADRCDDEERLPGRILVMVHAARRPHQSEDIERHERYVEPDEPAPERRLPERLVQPETENLREPVGEPGHGAEHHAA